MAVVEKDVMQDTALELLKEYASSEGEKYISIDFIDSLHYFSLKLARITFVKKPQMLYFAYGSLQDTISACQLICEENKSKYVLGTLINLTNKANRDQVLEESVFQSLEKNDVLVHGLCQREIRCFRPTN